MSDPDRLQTTVVKVTLLLTEQNVENANYIYAATQARTKAHVVSIALAFTKFVIEQRRNGSQLALRLPDGGTERIFMQELEQLNSAGEFEERLQKIKQAK